MGVGGRQSALFLLATKTVIWGITVNLELNKEEAELVTRVLADYLGNLRMEIGNTDSYDWRQDLKGDEERLKAVLARLGRPVGVPAALSRGS